MSEHPNVTTVNRMTQAIFEQDGDALAEIFAAEVLASTSGDRTRSPATTTASRGSSRSSGRSSR